ncbi:MAG: hypothetical protein ABL958_21470 [Bdellovibrionia bacterium]
METTFRVLVQAELDAVADFEKKMIESLGIPEQEAQLLSWSAPWRRESLDHYANTGWSFGAWRDGKIAGYFLAQPFVFFRGLTQTLWVEHLSAADTAIEAELIDIARRYGRDKHLQSVLFNENSNLKLNLKNLGGAPIADQIFEFKTTKANR